MKLKTLIITTVGAFSISVANAGDSKGVMEPAAAAPAPALGATISAGYDTHYIFRGVDNGQNAVSVALDYGLDMLPIPVSIGARYINPIDPSENPVVNPGGDDELQLSAAVSGPEIAGMSTWLGYTAYLFPENGGRNAGTSNSEVGGGVGTTVGPLDVSVAAYYDFFVDGWFFELTAGHTRELTDTVSLALAAGISYEVDFWGAFNGGADGWNNVIISAGLPIALTDTATLQPYVAATFALEAIDGFQDDQLFGGVSLSVDF